MHFPISTCSIRAQSRRFHRRHSCSKQRICPCALPSSWAHRLNLGEHFFPKEFHCGRWICGLVAETWRRGGPGRPRRARGVHRRTPAPRGVHPRQGGHVWGWGGGGLLCGDDGDDDGDSGDGGDGDGVLIGDDDGDGDNSFYFKCQCDVMCVCVKIMDLFSDFFLSVCFTLFFIDYWWIFIVFFVFTEEYMNMQFGIL